MYKPHYFSLRFENLKGILGQLWHCAGDTVNGIPIVCSGKSDVPTSSCSIYSNGNWIKYIKPISNRVYKASSVSLTNSLFVTGGSNSNCGTFCFNSDDFVSTTNLVFTNGAIKNGTNMPERIANHCMAKMYDGKVAAIIGGK